MGSSARALGVQVGILRRVFMPLGELGFHHMVMRAVRDLIERNHTGIGVY